MQVIRGHRFLFHTEQDLQAGIAQALDLLGIKYEREVCLTKCDRIDFMVGNVGIEVKVDGALNEVIRQVYRYMHCGQVSALMLITSKARHRLISGEMNGKPVY